MATITARAATSSAIAPIPSSGLTSRAGLSCANWCCECCGAGCCVSGLWNDNRESLRRAVSWDPERSILRWAWTRHEPQRLRYAAQADDRWVRLTNRAEVRRFLKAAQSSEQHLQR